MLVPNAQPGRLPFTRTSTANTEEFGSWFQPKSAAPQHISARLTNHDAMNDFRDLDVFLVDFGTGQPLVSFDTAKTIPQNSSRQRRYAVEAKADQRFAIEIQTAATFEWAGSNCLEVRLGFDVGEQVNCRSVYILKDRKNAIGLDLPYFSYVSGVYSYRMNHLLLEDADSCNTSTRPSHFYFRRLRSDNLVNSVKGLLRTFDSQGKIRVEVSRTVVTTRDQDRGIQVDVAPNYRRHTKEKLQEKGITLEVLLYIDPAEARTIYRGNFRSERPKARNQQANFDFIYRETGHHDKSIALDDIIEVGISRQDPLSKRRNRDSKEPSAPRSRESSTLVATPWSAFTEDVDNTGSEGDLCRMSQWDTGVEVVPESLPDQSIHVHNTPTGLTHTEPSRRPIYAGNFSFTPKAASTVIRASSLQNASLSASPAMTESTNISSTSGRAIEEISSLLKAQLQRAQSEAQELRYLRLKISEFDQRHKEHHAHCEALRVELEKLTAEAIVLDRTQQDLRGQERQIMQSSEESKAKTQQALDVFRDAIKEIEEQSIQSASARKRKRSED